MALQRLTAKGSPAQVALAVRDCIRSEIPLSAVVAPVFRTSTFRF